MAVAFPPLVIDSLAAHLSRLGMRQLHVAETEKYAHVTYFFNGGVEDAVPGRGPHPRAVQPRGADLRPRAGDERRTDHRRARRGHRLGTSTTSSSRTTPTRTWSVTPASGRRRCGPPSSSMAAWAACRGGAWRGRRRSVITADHGNIEEMRDEPASPRPSTRPRPVPLVLVSEQQCRAHGFVTASWPMWRRPSASSSASRRTRDDRPIYSIG